MGEIATWSAVKTKVGLGKDSNECPTKAELLALSPTGTGENYVGLEISNASSYGNNETVQLSDIHKVTYRYAFTVVDTVLNFPALGGYSTPRWFGLGTTKQKQIDGVAIGDTISVGYTQSAYPDWIVYDEGYKASENTTLNQRSASLTFTQNESGKQITVQFTQDAGVETWEYTFTSKNNSLVFNAIGGKGTPTELTITSNKQKYINGKAVGSPVNVDYSRPSLPSWLSVESGYYEALENKSESSRSYTDTLTQAESGKKLTPVLSQAAGVKTYGTPTVYLGSIADIPASGGTAATPTYTYSQLWGWNGKTDDGGTISSGASVVWSENISGSNLGTTAKARTKLGSRTLTVTLNGKSGSASIDVYQAENKITNVTQGAWVVSISANPSTFTEQGGTSQISASARASRTNHWSSGATNAASDATGTPTLSIPTVVTGFSLSGTTLTVAENTTANQRSVVVRATMDTVYKEVTVTQSAYLVEWVYTMTTTQPTLNFDALGTMQTCTITSYREKYINGSLVEGSMEGVNIRVKSSNAYIASTGSPNIREITMFENKTTNSRVGEVVYEQYDSGKTQTITCNQAAGTVTTRDVLEVISNFPDAPAAMGTNKVKGSVKCGYYDVINGKDSTWHSGLPTVKAKSSYITNVDIGRFSSTQIDITCTVSDNTSESSRRLSVDLTYGSKEIELACTQAGASIGYNYYFEVTSDFPSVAAAGATPKAVIKSRRYRVVNGVEESSYTRVDVSLFSKPNWTGVLSSKVSSTTGPGADYDVTLPVYENTSESVRNGAVVLQQSGSNKRVTLLINQSPAVVTWDYTFSIYSPSSKILNVPAKMIDPDTIICNSYRTKVVNGTQTSTKEFVEVTIDTIEENWLEVTKNSNDMTQVEFAVTCLENRVSSIRSATVTLRQVGSNKLDQVDINQSAATISTRYEVFWNAVKSNGPAGERVTEVEIDGYVNTPESAVRLDLIALEYTTINGVEGTPVSLNTRPVGNNNSVEVVPNGGDQLAIVVVNDVTEIDCTYIGILNAKSNLNEYPRTYTVTLTNPKVVLNGKEIGQAPTVTIIVNPIPYTRVFEFGWKQEGSTITNITLDGDIHGSSAGSRDIISYASLRRDGVEFAKKYIKPTFIASSGDWLQVIDNGQNSDNSYNWAFKALTNNEGDSARNQQVRFEQPGNGNQSLYAYVSQSPKSVPAFLHAYLYNTYNVTNNLQTRISWQGNTEEDGQIGDNLVISQGGYLGAYTGLNDGNLYVQFKGKPGAGINSSMYVSLQNLHIESGNEYEGTLKKVPLTIGPSGGSYNIQWSSFSIDNDAFNCRIADYGLNTEGGFIYFVVEKTDTTVSVLEGAQIGSISLHLNSNVEGFDGMFGTINIDFFYGMP
jgi:hypothetical protein